MGLLRDGIHTLPYAAMVAGAIFLTGIGSYQIGRDSAERTINEENDDYNHEKFPELYENYEEYVGKIATALKECNEERGILKDYAFYLTMLNYGCISYGSEFNMGSALPVEFGDALGATVASGNGYYRHVTANLADVLCSLGYEAKVVSGKKYIKGSERPSEDNYMVVYVEEDGVGYLLDPVAGTIYLKKSGLVYYDMKSQEESYRCFEPSLSYFQSDSESNNLDMLFNLGNDFKKHWDILKEFQELRNASNFYLQYFYSFETQELLENEGKIKLVFDDLVDEYNNVVGESKATKSR